ncbi:MAG: N-acetyltransferase [Planctomycetota bacterium]
MTVEVRAVASRRERRLFRDLPARLHGAHPAFVPMLHLAFADLFDRRRNPFWREAQACEWLAWRGGAPVGRVGACRDPALAQVAGCGAVGFFDAAEDPEAAAALFGAAQRWLAERGCRRARGPLNYTIHDTAGVLVQGFDTPPTIDTTWNPAYYGPLWESNGWAGAQDMLGLAGLVGSGPARGRRFAERARRKGAVVRPVDLRRFDAEAARVCAIFNRAWSENWGHVPIPVDEFVYKARSLKAVLDPDVIRIAEVDGEPVGLMLALPDLNVAVRKTRGRLLPFGWVRLLRARRCGRCRVMLLGVVPGYRRRGIEALLLSESFRAESLRYPWAEASWVLADNREMLNGLGLYNLHPYKRWRVYERDLAPPASGEKRT